MNENPSLTLEERELNAMAGICSFIKISPIGYMYILVPMEVAG